jgi:PAT family beta-lactamase induction signal transducer AmpG
MGTDIRIVGLSTVVQAPWSFKFLWSPLMDRYSVPRFGRRRGWIAVFELALFVSILCLAWAGARDGSAWPILWISLAIAFAAASQDIAIDAYAVEVLRKEEQGMAVGARTAVYRAAMFTAGGLSITLAGWFSWPAVLVGLALSFLPMMVLALRAPEPETNIERPTTLREAVWEPFVGFLSRERAVELLAFVLCYKLADNLAGALLRPFLRDMGYGDFDRGVALATVGTAATILGTVVGGALTNPLGLGHALWAFGLLQIVSNLGYILVASAGMNRPLMYGAVAFETLTQGMGSGAFSVLLLRMTQKRFSATQYALFSSLFGVPRIVSGPISGFAVHAVGWIPFFWGTMFAGIPGLLLLHRFAPLGIREPDLGKPRPRPSRPPLGPRALAARGAAAALATAALALVILASLDSLEAMRSDPGRRFDLVVALKDRLRPTQPADWLVLAGVLVAGSLAGLLVAALAAVRTGAVRSRAAEDPP